MNSTIETPRLTLVRLTDTSLGSQHLKWYHACWNDDTITSFSPHGKCHTIEESRAWMIQNIIERDCINYAILLKDANTSTTADQSTATMIGMSNLWNAGPNTQPTIKPPKSFSEDNNTSTEMNATATTTTTTTTEAGTKDKDEADTTNFTTIFLAYALLEPFYGKGYATEAARALIDEYRRFCEAEHAKGEQTFYIEAAADDDNYASQRILDKLGFTRLGWQKEEEKVFLGGKLREGYFVYGKYLF